jgi:hypothetical protein
VFQRFREEFDRDGFFYENPGAENDRPVRLWVAAIPSMNRISERIPRSLLRG